MQPAWRFNYVPHKIKLCATYGKAGFGTQPNVARQYTQHPLETCSNGALMPTATNPGTPERKAPKQNTLHLVDTDPGYPLQVHNFEVWDSKTGQHSCLATMGWQFLSQGGLLAETGPNVDQGRTA